MLLRRAITHLSIALIPVLLVLATVSSSAHAGKAYEEIFGKTQKSTTTAATSTTTAATTTTTTTAPSAVSPRVKSQGSVHRSAKKTPGLTTPKIATTVPRATTTAPSPGAGSGAATKGVPLSKTTPQGVVPSPTTTTTSSTTAVPPSAGGGLPLTRPGTTRQGTKKHTSLSAAAIVAAVLAALLILICLLWALARWSAYEPHWLLSLRHTMGEAGTRLSGLWDEFSDWARLGR